ncbi:MAG: winged helix-turn-helix transcriptional regulator [Planctomycetota bacterium]
MRPPAEQQSAVRNPLNRWMGTEANVRILRFLTSTQTPMSKAAVAREVSLNPSGVARSIDELVDEGIVEPLGPGSRRLYRLARGHSLSTPLAALYAAERNRFDSIVTALKQEAQSLAPRPRAAWIEGPVARGKDRPGDPIVVGLLASATDVDRLAEQFSDTVASLEQAYDVTLSVQGLTVADLSASSNERVEEWKHALPLLGPPPSQFLESRPDRLRGHPVRSHADIDDRLLELARAIADMLVATPSLLERAQRVTTRHLQSAGPHSRRVFEEWDRILRTMSLARMRRFLVEESDRATRLRQSMPFLEALNAREREALGLGDHDA